MKVVGELVFYGLVRAQMQRRHADVMPEGVERDFGLSVVQVDWPVQVDGVDYPIGEYWMDDDGVARVRETHVIPAKAKRGPRDEPRMSGLNKAIAAAKRTRK